MAESAETRERTLARRFVHEREKKRIEPKYLDEIEEFLGDYVGHEFPWSAWSEARAVANEYDLGGWLEGIGVDLDDLDRWLAENDVPGNGAVNRLIRMATEGRWPAIKVRAFSAGARVGDVGTPIDPNVMELESLAEDDWPPVPRAKKSPKPPAWSEEFFLKKFERHLIDLRYRYDVDVRNAGGEREYELAETGVGGRRLMDLAWVLEKLKPQRTCVAVIWTGSSLVLFANTVDLELVLHARSVMSVLDEIPRDAEEVTPTEEDTPVLFWLITKIMESTGRWISGEEEVEERDARAVKALRRVIKAANQLKYLEETSGELEIEAHGQNQANKHAEMQVLDSFHQFAVGSVAISKICCAKCYAAIDAAATVGHADLRVQGAHFGTYETKSGWPMPHFLIEKPHAMQAFLGDEGYKWYEWYPDEVIAAIEGRKLKVPHSARADPYSSDEEPKRKKKLKLSSNPNQ